MPIHGLPFKDEQLFNLINVVLPGWLLLAVAPRWHHSQTISAIAALLVSALYSALLINVMAYPDGHEKLDFSDMFTYEVRGNEGKRSLYLPPIVHQVHTNHKLVGTASTSLFCYRGGAFMWWHMDKGGDGSLGKPYTSVTAPNQYIFRTQASLFRDSCLSFFRFSPPA